VCREPQRVRTNTVNRPRDGEAVYPASARGFAAFKGGEKFLLDSWSGLAALCRVICLLQAGHFDLAHLPHRMHAPLRFLGIFALQHLA
jgi:hypothetical protein